MPNIEYVYQSDVRQKLIKFLCIILTKLTANVNSIALFHMDAHWLILKATMEWVKSDSLNHNYGNRITEFFRPCWWSPSETPACQYAFQSLMASWQAGLPAMIRYALQWPVGRPACQYAFQSLMAIGQAGIRRNDILGCMTRAKQFEPIAF